MVVVLTNQIQPVVDGGDDGSHQQPVDDANAVLFSTLHREDQYDDTTTDNSNYGYSNNVVTVRVERNLPISACKAKEAWNEFIWRDSPKRMMLWPLLLQEERQQQDHHGGDQDINSNADDDDGQEEIFKIHSQVVKLGALQWEVLPQHGPPTSLVSFAPCPITNGGDLSLSSGGDSCCSCCHFTWQVQLAAKHPQLVHALTSFWMNATVNEWMDAMIATPRLLHRQVVIPKVTVDAVVNAWLDFVWIQGGGLPLPFPPILLPPSTKSSQSPERDKDSSTELSHHRCRRRIIVPPGLSESILSITHHPGDKQGMIRYQVDNPGILTSYPVHMHHGLVHVSETTMGEEEEKEPSVQLDWFVEIRPFRRFAWFAEAFTESIVITLSRNLAVHMFSVPFGSGMVKVSPPRGKGKSFATVRKDSWLGGVLEAHLTDDRSTFQQTCPWTWGRATDSSLLKPGILKDAHTAWSSSNLNETMVAAINSGKGKGVFCLM